MLVGKNNVGIVAILILVILLSQSRFFDFLTETALGRLVLLAFVVLTAYSNKMLGLVAVLFIILAFNNNDVNMVYSYNYYEGFDGSGNMVGQGAVAEKAKEKETNLKNKVTTASNNMNSASQTATTTSSSVSGTETFKGREGFCMTDRESNMLRGKQSNTVPVFNNLREQSEDVSPSDKSVFTSDYASF